MKERPASLDPSPDEKKHRSLTKKTLSLVIPGVLLLLTAAWLFLIMRALWAVIDWAFG